MKMKVSFWTACLVLSIGNNLTGQQEDLSSIEFRLKNFRFDYGLANSLESASIADFLQLVDDQKTELAKIKKKYVNRAAKISDNQQLKPEERLEKMGELTNPLNEELERVLLPHQKKLLERFGFYNRVRKEGLVNSMLQGEIAKELEFSKRDIRAIKAEAETMYGDYRQSMIEAQQRAIAKLVESYPKEKQDQLKRMLAPMLDGNGLIDDDIVGWHFQINDKAVQENTTGMQIMDQNK